MFYSRLLKKNFAVEIIPKEEQGWKSIRRWAGIWRSANSRYSRLGMNEGLIAILARPPSLSPPMIAIRTSDHLGSNFGYKGQVFRGKDPMLGIKLNPLSLLFQLSIKDITVIIVINSFNHGFRSCRRNHMFSCMCIMRMRAWWLPCVFFWFLWRQRS